MLPWIVQLNQQNKKAVAYCTVFLATAFFVFLILFGVMGLPSVVGAQVIQDVGTSVDTFGLQPIEDSTVLGGADIRIIIAKIIRAIFGLLGIIAVGLILYAGYMIMTSGGEEDKIATGKKILMNAVIGLAIILSALAIVQFVLGALSGATGSGNVPTGRARPPRLETFSGSGALGRIIKDHYPGRGDEDVKRNTKITVTFREAIDPGSVILDSNANGTIGDCLDVAFDGSLDWWRRNCDLIRTSSVRIFRDDGPDTLLDAVAIAPREGQNNAEVFTFVLKPLALLGSSTTTILHTVTLTDNIRKADGRTSAFDNNRGRRYSWGFETGTQTDTIPPRIVSIYPFHGDAIPRNSIIQIVFDDAMDPTAVQGVTGEFTHILFGISTPGAVLPQGEWRISNGYRTVEFVSNDPCGQNSCGELMYCLPDCSVNSGGAACRNEYRILVRTAELFGSQTGTNTVTTFEARPFTGVMDMAGNALDSGPENTRRSPSGIIPADGIIANPHAPTRAGAQDVIRPGEQAPDNFWWNFRVENRIDRSVPYIERVTPGIDEEEVVENSPLSFTFNTLMWDWTMRDISLDEFPADSNGIDPVWFVPRTDVIIRGDNSLSSRVNIRHRAFGPNDTDLYYFPSVPSTVRSVNQNCMYPGRGPFATTRNTSPVCAFEAREDGTVVSDSGCIPFGTVDSSTDTGCVQTSVQDENVIRQPNIAQCLSTMRRSDISSI